MSIVLEVKGAQKAERLTVTEWQRERGTTKKQRKRSRRSGTSKIHHKKYLEWREAKRRVGFAWFVTLDLWCFLAVPLPLFSTERWRDCRAETPG